MFTCIAGAEEEKVGRNRDKEFKEEQSREYIRPYEIIFLLLFRYLRLEMF